MSSQPAGPRLAVSGGGAFLRIACRCGWSALLLSFLRRAPWLRRSGERLALAPDCARVVSRFLTGPPAREPVELEAELRALISRAARPDPAQDQVAATPVREAADVVFTDPPYTPGGRRPGRRRQPDEERRRALIRGRPFGSRLGVARLGELPAACIAELVRETLALIALQRPA